jgi:ribonuclease HI
MAVAAKHSVKFVWVKGHAGNTYNERCDELAVAACTGRNLPADTWYEQNASSN